jgi:hypothetical protein
MTGDLKVQLCRLYEKTSARGTRYFVGRVNGLKVVVLKDDRTQADGADAVWNLYLSPTDGSGQGGSRPSNPSSSPPRQQRSEPARARAQRRPEQQSMHQRMVREVGERYSHVTLNDEIPDL